jgi:Ni,Fe-hydrogenase III large subunit/NADH:ubiquinone oxidoreductase subunit C
MSTTWIDTLRDNLSARDVALRERAVSGFARTRAGELSSEHWGALAREARALDARWAGTWGEDGDTELLVHTVFEKDGHYLAARTAVKRTTPILPSHTPHYLAADRPERHIQDMFGVAFSDHPDTRRWARHQAWKDNEYPLRKDFPVAGTGAVPTTPGTDDSMDGGGRAASGIEAEETGRSRMPEPTPPDDTYRFLFAHGSGVYEIPVGPVHAGIIEPGHFRFQAVGEMVLNLEERLGYVHKGIEKIAEGRDAFALARLASRVSGDSTVAHAWAACMAMEQAVGLDVPRRALYLRAIMAERERVANHLGDLGAILNDIAFTFGFYQFGRLREDWTRLSYKAFGHRFMMDRIIPGGVATHLDEGMAATLRNQLPKLRKEVEGLMAIVYENASIEDRLETAGTLKPEVAKAFGALGYVGRASMQPFDVRHHAPYAPYDRLKIKVPLYHYGDVAARVKVRAEEIFASLTLLETLLTELPTGPSKTDWQAPAENSTGLAFTEGFRGECLAYVRFGADGKIARYFPRDPSWLTWPTLEKLIRDNIVPDFPVCNKSVNGSYSGHDL